MADKLMFNPNDDTQYNPICRLQILVETFEHSIKWTNQSKFNECSQSCWASELGNINIKLKGLM